MKKISVILAALVLFAGVSFANPVVKHAKQAQTKEQKKGAKKTEKKSEKKGGKKETPKAVKK